VKLTRGVVVLEPPRSLKKSEICSESTEVSLFLPRSASKLEGVEPVRGNNRKVRDSVCRPNNRIYLIQGLICITNIQVQGAVPNEPGEVIDSFANLEGQVKEDRT
jgi:hypothetical protein